MTMLRCSISTSPENPDVIATTIINGQGRGSVVTFHGGEDSRCLLKGFTITGGGTGCGGGIRGNGSTATISKCIITGNSAGDDGGGLYECGGGIRGCVITNNVAVTRGAGLAYCDGAITNCIISNNYGCEGGGGLWRCDGPIINCTIANNQCYYGSCGLYGCNGAIVNCIIWGDVGGNHLYQCSTPSYSCIQDWDDDGVGNIDTDPCFADPGYWHDNDTPDYSWDDFWIEGDYHLKSQAGRWDPNSGSWVKDEVTSPCIDGADPMTPIGHEPFPNGGVINMGAYGGASKASKSYFGELVCETIVAGDINGDCEVDFKDFGLMSFHWLEVPDPDYYTPPIIDDD